MTEHGRRILEHDHVDAVGTEPVRGVGREVEPLSPPRRRVEPGRECHGEIDIRARAGTAGGAGAEQMDGRDRGVAGPDLREDPNPLVKVLGKRAFREHARILRRRGVEGNQRFALPPGAIAKRGSRCRRLTTSREQKGPSSLSFSRDVSFIRGEEPPRTTGLASRRDAEDGKPHRPGRGRELAVVRREREVGIAPPRQQGACQVNRIE